MVDVLTAWLLLIWGSHIDAEQRERYLYQEQISVELMTLAVRVIDDAGRPLEHLTPADFVVRYRQRSIPVVAVEWIEGSTGALQQGVVDGDARPRFAPRLILLWVQTDLRAIRISGLLHIQPFVRHFLDSLEDEDLVAVASFDSRLKLWHDFSRDRAAQAGAVEEAVRFGKSPLLRRSGEPSLAEHMDFRAARSAATAEAALRVTAESLRALPGEKILVYLGWGLGRRGSHGFSMTGDYQKARRALAEAQTSVFVLDITNADHHTLELGLRTVAADTGGTYEKTNRYSQQAIDKLIRAISGYYLLTVDRTGQSVSASDLEIRIPGRKTRILTRGG